MINRQQALGIDSSHLIPVGPQHLLLPEAASAFVHMQAAAAKDNIDIQICSSFRSFERQLAIWNKKWRAELPLYTLTGDTLNALQLDDIERINAIMLWSALPGASRHHWGSDFDVFDAKTVQERDHDFQLVPQEYEHDGPCARMNDWIQTHAHEFGFYFPYAEYCGGVAQEPWHMSFKTSAYKIEQQFSVKALQQQLLKTDILGKQAIVDNLPALVSRYTFNKGTLA